MKDSKKNLTIVIAIAVAIAVLTEVFHIAEYLFPIMVVAVAVWFIITPFKLVDNE